MPATARSTFVPTPLDATRWENVEPLYQALLERPVESAAEFEQWLLDRSELDAACGESRAELYIRMTCHTDDEEASGAYSRYIDEVPPKLRPVAFELDKRQAVLHRRFVLDARRYEVIERAVRADVDLFRAENVALMTELEKLAQEYQKITAAMTVVYDGEERTLPQMVKYLQVTDRAVRESSWRAVAERRLQDRDRIDAIYDQMIEVRGRVGRNAGFRDFRDYTFKAMHRFDYTPKDCEAFHHAVEHHVVPLLRRLNERRRKHLKLEALRPWDLAVDEKGRAPLRPFTDGNDMLKRTRGVFRSMGSGLDVMFESLGENGSPGEYLDLDSRKGKAPGGYQYMRDRTRRPFIFMNAAGVHRDVETIVHEAGHAFHSMLCKDEPLVAYRESPIEFAEVASMGIELLSMPNWGSFYPSEEDLGRAVREHLEGNISILAWIPQIDAFQHWVYTRPDGKPTDRDERNRFWLSLDARFGPRVEWDGLEDSRAWQWQRQLHLFIHPFYFIEYGIALLGSLGLWLHALEHGQKSALERYKRALSLGGSRPLPELFEAAGLPFDFGEATVQRLVSAVERELAKLPE